MVASPAILRAGAETAQPAAAAGVASISPKPIARSRPRRVFGVLRRHLVLGVSVGAVVLTAVMFGPRLVLGPTVGVEAVARADFVQTVVAIGRVETPHRVDVSV